MKKGTPRPLTRREQAVARLAVERTLADLRNNFALAATAYDRSDPDAAARIRWLRDCLPNWASAMPVLEL